MKRKGFGFIDILAAIALLLICSMLLSFGLNDYYKNLYMIKANDRMESLVRDEILLIQTTKNYENKTVGSLILRYEEMGSISFHEQTVSEVLLKIEDGEYGIQKEYRILFEE